jgi:DNA-directed RNA polymerase subunit RPC12/RpoP
MIEFPCKGCSQKLKVEEKHSGKRIKCPKCGSIGVVPDKSDKIEFHCTNCGQSISVPEIHAGKQGKCPKCKKVVVVPALQKEPVKKESGTTNITCSMCGEAIGITEDLAEALVECPGCGSTIDASSGSPVSEAEDAESYDMDEDLYKESAASHAWAGPDRRLVMVIAGVAAIVAVGLIGLVILIRSSGSKPAPTLIPSHQQQETAETNASPQPVVANKPAPEPSPAPETGESLRLQFSPSPGDKRSLCVSTQVDMSIEQGGKQEQVTSTQTITVDLEAGEASANGTTSVGIMLTQIQLKTKMGSTTAGTYDSAEATGEDDPMAGIYGPFVGKRFTIGVSAQGDIIDSGLDELFLAVAEDRMQAEDDMLRKQNKERADAEIARTDQRFGSRQARALATKKQLEDLPLFGTGKIRDLLDQMIASLPEEPVQHGASWTGTLAVSQGTGMPVEMPATYAVTAIEKNTCMINAQG